MDFDVPILSCWVPEQQGAFEQLGVEGYLVKPVDRDDLLASMAEVAPDAHSILLVDDDPEARQLFGRMLSDDDGEYGLLQAGDGEAALRMLRERQPDLLLLDLMMPHVDGFAVLEHKAGDENIRDIPTLILSARDPQKEPIISKALSVQRQNGLSARDLALALEAVTQALTPRFGAAAQRETIDALQVSG
jgi:CheY-like chemotaxis protein